MSELPFTRIQLELMDHVFGCASLGKKLGLSKEQKQQCARIALVFEALVSQKRVDNALKKQTVKVAKEKEKAAARKGGEKFVNSARSSSTRNSANNKTSTLSKARNKSNTKQTKRR